ncbi:MAG: VOC family protein [Emcibacter sp.]|nr:VOC family protein [Emcibacter sp.]
MPPKLDGIDHIHLYVTNREDAAKWYEDILGFTSPASYAFWAKDAQGPLVIEDPSGNIHLALFQRETFIPSAVIAFGVEGKDFLAWKKYLEGKNLLDNISDHTLSWSLYFKDPYGNGLEITTYQYDYVSDHLQA